MGRKPLQTAGISAFDAPQVTCIDAGGEATAQQVGNHAAIVEVSLRTLVCTHSVRSRTDHASWSMHHPSHTYSSIKELAMLETVAIVLVILWALGLVSSYSMGGFIHVLLVIALVVFLIRIIRGRRL